MTEPHRVSRAGQCLASVLIDGAGGFTSADVGYNHQADVRGRAKVGV